jgi:murein DD-endopeptidase MepM/ murein hydrolase activator NlpD
MRQLAEANAAAYDPGAVYGTPESNRSTPQPEQVSEGLSIYPDKFVPGEPRPADPDGIKGGDFNAYAPEGAQGDSGLVRVSARGPVSSINDAGDKPWTISLDNQGLGPDYGVPAPYPEFEHPRGKAWTNPTGGGIREQDSKGSGYFGAPRGAETHKGADFVGTPGDPVVAVQGGTVLYVGRATAKDLSLRYIEIDGGDGYVSRQNYVSPDEGVKRGMQLYAGQRIGTQQSLQSLYPGITEHVDVKIRFNGEWMDPATLIGVPR